MGVIEFFILCVAVVLIAALAVWAIGYFAPTHPPVIDKIMWGIALLIILTALVQAIGLLHFDPQIPRLR